MTMKRIIIQIAETDHEILRRIAFAKKKSVAAVVRDSLKKILDKYR